MDESNVTASVVPTDQVLNEDCFVVAADLPDKSVDVVLTDPPYPNRAKLFGDSLVDGIAMLYLACKKARKYVIFFWSPFNIPQPPRGWYLHAQHVWAKPDSKSPITWETITVWSRENKLGRCKVWSIPILDYRSLRDWQPHPTQKPVKLLRYLVQDYSEPGDLIMDPFVGSGSTAVACQQLGRHYLGVEIDPKYYEIAKKRLQAREPRKEPTDDGTAGPPSTLPKLPDDGLPDLPPDTPEHPDEDVGDANPPVVEDDQIEEDLPPAIDDTDAAEPAAPAAEYVSHRQRPPTARAKTARRR